jgi:hypothetical protein
MLILFSFLTIINVVFSTIKSIVTIKSGKTVAALISAGYYGYYNIVLIYTVADFPLWQKVVTQRESAAVKKSLDRYNAKYFVTESKTL